MDKIKAAFGSQRSLEEEPLVINREYALRQAADAKRKARRSFAMSGLCGLALLWLLWTIDPHSTTCTEPGRSESDGQAQIPTIDAIYDSITPSEELIYHDCRGPSSDQVFNCARLLVPVDYNRTDGKGGSFALAILRKPARVPITDPRYGGPILINPGGPGGAGVEMLAVASEYLSNIVDAAGSGREEAIPAFSEATENDKYYDLISWDPRAIGKTTPTLSCFPDSAARDRWGDEDAAIGILGSSENAFTLLWARSQALAEGCSERHLVKNEHGEALAEHVNTTPTVRDLLSIIDSHQEWVQRTRDAITPAGEKLPILEAPAKLQYWGFSYGTVIGQTFATMFPDRVHRIVVDGVVDAEDFYNGPWFSPLPDTDKIFDQLLTYCFQSGPDACPIYHKNGPAHLKQWYLDIENDIRETPIVVPSVAFENAGTPLGPDIITWSDMKDFLRYAMYQPAQFFPVLADYLPELAARNGTRLANFKRSHGAQQTCPWTNESCKKAGWYSGACNQAGVDKDATMAIMCSDAPGLNAGKEEFLKFWHRQSRQSKLLGGWWTKERLQCIGWKAEAKWRVHDPIAGNTSHPLLFISNTLDPVTPLRNSHKMSKHFAGSVVLQQDSEGHCSFSSRSLCTAKVIRTYFQTGKLPEKGMVCKPVERPFLGEIPAGSESAEKGGEELGEALKGLKEVMVQFGFGSVGGRRLKGFGRREVFEISDI